MLSEHKITAFIILGIFFLSFGSALSFQQSQEVDVKLVCINAGYCSTATVCNVSVFNPDELVLLDAITATQAASLGSFNFTLTSDQTGELGEYRVGGFCQDGSVTNIIDFTFDVTADGKEFNVFPTEFVIILFSFIFVSLGLFQERLRMFKHIGSILMMIMGVITLFPGYSFINWTTLSGLALGTVLIGLGFYFLVEDSFSREEQDDTFEQDGRGEDLFR